MKAIIGLTIGFVLRFCGLWMAHAGYRIEAWAGVSDDDWPGSAADEPSDEMMAHIHRVVDQNKTPDESI